MQYFILVYFKQLPRVNLTEKLFQYLAAEKVTFNWCYENEEIKEDRF